MNHTSVLKERGRVSFPAYLGDRIYMEPFRKADGLPARLRRWQPTVDAMLAGIETDSTIFLMVDQSPVSAGKPHRRPGVHVDGYWNVGGHDQYGSVRCHGSIPSGGHGSYPVGHGASPQQRHNGVPSHNSTPLPVQRHRGETSHSSSLTGASSWEGATFSDHEGLILASDVQGCRAYVGAFDGGPRDGGDCAHVDLSGLQPVDLAAGTVYAGNVTVLHESIPVPVDGLRTLVRLNVPGWTP